LFKTNKEEALGELAVVGKEAPNRLMAELVGGYLSTHFAQLTLGILGPKVKTASPLQTLTYPRKRGW